MRRCALLVLFIAIAAAPAIAADIQWLGVNSTWTDVNNWSGGVVPGGPGSGDSALFTGNAALVSQPIWDTVVGGFKFDTAGWTVTCNYTGQWGGGLEAGNGISIADSAAGLVTFTGAGIIACAYNGTPAWHIGTGSTLAMGIGVADSYATSWTRSGTGTLHFTGSPVDMGAGGGGNWITLVFPEGLTDINSNGFENFPMVVGQASGAPASVVFVGTAPTHFVRGNVITINATGTLNYGPTGCDGTQAVTINGGSLIMAAGQGFSIGRNWMDATTTLTMTGGSVTGTPIPQTDMPTVTNTFMLWGPGVITNAASTTAVIAPSIYFAGGRAGGQTVYDPILNDWVTTYPNPPMDHSLVVAKGAAAIDLDIQGGVRNDTRDPNLNKTGLGTVRIGGAINWAGGNINVNAGTLLYDGTGNGQHSVVVNDTGTLGGTGNVALGGANTLTVNAGGTLSPGASVGTLTTGGGAVLMGGVALNPAKLLNQVDASGSDQLAMTGALTLNNGGPTLLQLSLLSHFVPTNAASYTIVNGFSSLTGAFANAAGVSGSGRVDLGFKGWEGVITYNATDIVLSDLVMNGDTNGDGIVNFADYGNLTNNYNAPGDRSTGDMNGDGIVNFADYGILTNNYGVATPEPASLSLLVLGGLALIRRRR